MGMIIRGDVVDSSTVMAPESEEEAKKKAAEKKAAEAKDKKPE